MLRSTRATWTHGRRGALIGASAAVVCLGGVLAACGDGAGEGYVATGAAGGPAHSSGTPVRPTGGVTLVPLDGGGATATATAKAPSGGDPPARGTASDGSSAARGPRADTGPTPAPSSAEPSRSGRTSTSAPSPAPSSGRTTPGGPAALTVDDPVREATDKHWCEKVTLGFRNTGGTAVRSGTVTFGTHVVDVLGIDWATVESTRELPAPIAAGARGEKTWTVCVDAWRVPLGMHIETRDVSVRWT